MSITRKNFCNSYTIVSSRDGNGVHVDLVCDPDSTCTENETYYKIVNMKKTGCYRFSYAFSIERAIVVYNDEVEQNERGVK